MLTDDQKTAFIAYGEQIQEAAANYKFSETREVEQTVVCIGDKEEYPYFTFKIHLSGKFADTLERYELKDALRSFANTIGWGNFAMNVDKQDVGWVTDIDANLYEDNRYTLWLMMYPSSSDWY